MASALIRCLALLAVLRAAEACDEACMIQASDVASDDSLGLLQRHAAAFATQRSGQTASNPLAAPCNPSGPVQVFADVDDTFMSSGGSWPAGCDGVYEKHVIYPGFAQFVLELSRGPNESLRVLRPGLFSARPEGFHLEVTEGSPMAAVLAANKQDSEEDPTDWDQLNGEIPLQVPGNLVSYNYQQGGIATLLQNGTGEPFGLNIGGSKYGHWTDFADTHKFGETKFENFQEFYLEEAAAQSSKACVVFIGDDGQGDCNPAAEEMKRYVKHDPPELGLKAAFIHRLNCSSKARCSASEAEPGSALVVKFDDYLDAARQAQQHGLISSAGVRRVRDSVAIFFAIYCHEDGSSRLTETLGDLGCGKLRESLEKVTGPTPSDAVIAQMRPMQRLRAFCESCCNGAISNHRATYDFQRKKLRCHHMYSESSWYHLWRTAASDDDCRHKCS